MADGSGIGNSTVGSLLGDGFAEGVMHVITGPDHLSAIIVLTAGTSWHSWRLGALWGFGHSLAMVVLSIPYVLSNEGFDIDTLGFYFDFIVGILMMLLGLWGLSHYIQARDHARDKWITNEMAVGRGAFDPRGRDLQVVQENDTPAASSHNHAGHEQNVPELGGDDYYQRLSQQQRRPMNAADEMALAGSYSYCRACGGVSTDITNSTTMQVMALAYGFVHGLAGTGGVIGELSHDVTHTAGKLAAYLGMISIGSIFIMSVVAAVYGELSGRFMVRSDANFYYGGVFSSMVSFCVGLLWIVLCDTQQLDNVFG